MRERTACGRQTATGPSRLPPPSLHSTMALPHLSLPPLLGGAHPSFISGPHPPVARPKRPKPKRRLQPIGGYRESGKLHVAMWDGAERRAPNRYHVGLDDASHLWLMPIKGNQRRIDMHQTAEMRRRRPAYGAYGHGSTRIAEEDEVTEMPLSRTQRGLATGHAISLLPPVAELPVASQPQGALSSVALPALPARRSRPRC